MANVAWHALEKKALYTITCRAERAPSLLQSKVCRDSCHPRDLRILQNKHHRLSATGLPHHSLKLLVSVAVASA